MSGVNINHSISPRVVFELTKKTLPFSRLEGETLERLAGHWTISFYPRGSLILEQDTSEVEFLHLIQKGGVRIFRSNEDPPEYAKEFRADGEIFGARPLLSGEKAHSSVEAVEDSFCFLLEASRFKELAESNPQFKKHFVKNLSEDLVTAAYSELRFSRVVARDQDTFYLFNSRIRDLVSGPPEIISGWTSIKDSAVRMSELTTTSLLVQAPNGVIGIVTDKDFRSKVVANALDHKFPVAGIMAHPVKTIGSDALCYEALITMMREQVHHLVVEDGGEMKGIVSADDIVVYQGSSPLSLLSEIVAQNTLSGLHETAKRIPDYVRSMVEEGAKARNISKTINLLTANLRRRLLTLIAEEMGSPPVPFCWLALGSEGRKEQVFGTDQDNALVYMDPDDRDEAVQAESYFDSYSRLAVDHLEACGYPRCRLETMASNPAWRKPYSVWTAYFEAWMSSPDPREVANSSIFFDFATVYGSKPLGDHLRKRVTDQVQRQLVFLRHLASDFLLNQPPLSFFRDTLVERGGGRSARLDLKRCGLAPLVNFARLMALRYGIDETNTLDRLQLLVAKDRLSRELYLDVSEAYEYLNQLLLVHRLEQVENGKPPDTYVTPGELSRVQKMTLKQTFGVIAGLHERVRREFPFAM